jgi:hypothetical protein
MSTSNIVVFEPPQPPFLQTLAEMNEKVSHPCIAPIPTVPLRSPLDWARTLYDMRRSRGTVFGLDIFAEPAWDMMLDVFIAHSEGRRVSVSSLCIGSAVPATTALRWISILTEREIFIRSADETDARRVFIDLTPHAYRQMHGLLSKL